jgi:hypothetical protein
MHDPNNYLYQGPQPEVKPWDRPYWSCVSQKEIYEVGFVWQAVWTGPEMELLFLWPREDA